MHELRSLRELADWTQTRLARECGINRAKISLAECQETELTAEEEATIRRVLMNAIQERSAKIRAVLEDYEGVPA